MIIPLLLCGCTATSVRQGDFRGGRISIGTRHAVGQFTIGTTNGVQLKLSGYSADPDPGLETLRQALAAALQILGGKP